MTDCMPILPPLEHHADSRLQIVSLPPDVRPAFFIPRLVNKPQNPIMNTLELLRNASAPVAHCISSSADCEEKPSSVERDAALEGRSDLWMDCSSATRMRTV